MKIAFAALLLAACAADQAATTPVTPPDTRVLTDLYPTVQQHVEASQSFAIDLGACDSTNHTVAIGDGNQFALSRLNEAGQCEVWVGYASAVGVVHADVYCAFEPYGSAPVTAGSVSSGGGCGGPPGTQPLTITAQQCVSLY